MTIVITGATGLIGTSIITKLLEAGRDVTALVRDLRRPPLTAIKRTEAARLGDLENVQADLEVPGPWCESLANAKALIHLAGEPVAAKRWDARQKQAIRDSRVESTRTLVEALGKLPAEKRPRAIQMGRVGVDDHFAPLLAALRQLSRFRTRLRATLPGAADAMKVLNELPKFCVVGERADVARVFAEQLAQALEVGQDLGPRSPRGRLHLGEPLLHAAQAI